MILSPWKITSEKLNPKLKLLEEIYMDEKLIARTKTLNIERNGLN